MESLGWGQIGNQNIPSFAYADVVSTYDTWVYGFNSGLNLLKAYASTSKGNKDIKWETVEQGNIGVDLGFFKNSLTLSADAYIKTTRDMLMQNPLPGMAGYPTTPWVNAGSVENRGLEFLIGYQGKVGDFRYSVSANFTFQKNKLVETGTNDPIWGTVSKNEIGEEFGRFYGYVYVLGIGGLALYTILAFLNKRLNAVFLGKSYLIIIFLSNLLLLLGGDYGDYGWGSLPQILKALIFGKFINN